ncbi:MAG: hypothetical protein DSY59_05105 [Persephonella sp.]|nr:MAG: hypothetical protein DSY60_04345 [Persephonella sp.]RUM58954.1 MAG: hypothetical protein DSY59_05105 [Persephonella sp.]
MTIFLNKITVKFGVIFEKIRGIRKMDKKIIEQLLKLQETDKRIYQLEKKVSQYPTEVMELEEQKKEELKKLDSIKKELKKLNSEKKDKELDIQEKREKIQKIEISLNNVKTNREYRELLRQKAILEKEILNIEDKILEIMEKLENLENEKDSLEKEINEKLREIDEEIEKKNSALEKSKRELEDLKSLRENLAKEIDPQFISKYELIRSKVSDGLVIAMIDDNNDVCPACFIVLPPRLYSDILKNPEKLFICPNCGRFLCSKENV